MSKKEDRTQEVKEHLDEFGKGVFTDFEAGVPMEDECPNCEVDRWDIMYHGHGVAGFQCMNCGCVKQLTDAKTEYVHEGKVVNTVFHK